MDNVNDLLKSAPTQTISLNALTGNKPVNNAININTIEKTNSSVSENNGGGITLSSTKYKHPRRTIVSKDTEPKEIDPSTIIPKKEAPVGPSIKDNAMNMLDAAVQRKKDEYNQFIQTALEMDKTNRERVEAGLETIEGEVEYIPPAVEEEIKRQENPENNDIPVKKLTSEEDEYSAENIKKRQEDSEEFYDKEEEEFFDDLDETIMEAPTATITSPMNVAVDDEPEKEEGDVMEIRPFSDTVPEETAHDILGTEKKIITTDDGIEIDEPVLVENIPNEVINIMEVTDNTKKPEIGTVSVDTNLTDAMNAKKPTKKLDDGTDELLAAISKNSIKVKSSVIDTIEDKAKNTTSSDFNLDDADFEDVTVQADAGEVQLTDDQIKEIVALSEKNLRSEILKKVINASKKLDTTSFTVANKVISIKDALKGSDNKVKRTATYPMMYSGRPFKASALMGPEIALLADTDDSGSENSVGLTMEQCRILYEHDANPYKPKTVEAWAKTIPFGDIEGIFAALYIASLKHANYVPMVCPKQACSYSFLSDDIKIEQMIKFANDDIKKRFDEISNIPITPENTGSYESVISPINDKYAIGLKVPSIFTILYEYASLNPAFIRKYISVVSIMQYIDYIYVINKESQQYVPIGWKQYAGDNSKTFRSKIATYSKILKEFDDTDFSVLTALINSMVSKNRDTKDITYEIPAGKCPKCGATIEARPILPREMVFMRQRLVALATSRSER